MFNRQFSDFVALMFSKPQWLKKTNKVFFHNVKYISSTLNIIQVIIGGFGTPYKVQPYDAQQIRHRLKSSQPYREETTHRVQLTFRSPWLVENEQTYIGKKIYCTRWRSRLRSRNNDRGNRKFGISRATARRAASHCFPLSSPSRFHVLNKSYQKIAHTYLRVPGEVVSSS